MCATFQLVFDDDIEELKQIANALSDKYGSEAAAVNRDFFPKMNVPVIGPGQKVSLLNWGFPVTGSSRVIFNARSESLTEKSAFKSYTGNRCLVPATSFYEWDGEKNKYRLRFSSRPVIYMAALWKPVAGADGKKEFHFVIITTEPNKAVRSLHSRMPAVIAWEQTSEWLGGAEALSLLKPFEESMVVERV